MSDSTARLEGAARRNRLLALGVVTTTVNRAVAVAVPLLVIPIALDQLGVAGYGAWAAAVSITSLVAFADLGIGTGLMTRLGATTEGKPGAPGLARTQVSTAYAMVGAVAVVLLALLWLSAPLFDWAEILGADHEQNSVERIFLITMSAFLVNMAASLVVRVQYGIGHQARSNIWQAAGSLLMLGMVWVTAGWDDGPLTFVVAAAFTPVLVAAANTVTFFAGRHGRAVRPSWRRLDRTVGAGLLRLGLKFLLVSVFMAVSLALDPVIVAHTSGLGNVAAYTIPYRIFTLVGTVAVMATLPLWPLNAGALAAGDTDWIRRTTMRMTIGCTAAVAAASALVVAVGPRVVDVWLGGRIDFDPVLWTGMALSWVVQVVASAAFMVQNGAEVVRPQLVGYALLLTAVPVKVLVGSFASFVWIPWAGAVLYCLFIWPACRVGYRQALSRVNASSVGAS